MGLHASRSTEGRGRLYDSIVDTIGNTPCIRLNRIAPKHVRLYVKAEFFNPLASVKDRIGKAMIEAAASHAHVEMQARYDARNPAALKQLVAAKTKLVQFPKPVLDAAFKASMDIYGELNEKNPAWRKVYSDYAKFRADQNMWFRFTEATYDRYLQAAKL